MRAILLVILMAATPAFADDLTLTLDSNIGAGLAPGIAPDPDPPCLPPSCVLFSGTLTDNDTDGSYIITGPDPDFDLNDISVAFSSGPASGGLTLDNTWDDFATQNGAGVLIGDPNAATDGAPFLNSYTGALFGIDIAPGTTAGQYTGTVTIEAQHVDQNFNPIGDPFTVSAQITVDVTPEPGGASLALAGLAVLGASYGLRRKWRSSAASR